MDLTAELPPPVQQALGLHNLVRVRLEAAATDEVAKQAVSGSVAPLINSRGGGQCVICQTKMKEDAQLVLGPTASINSDNPASTTVGATADDKFPSQARSAVR